MSSAFGPPVGPGMPNSRLLPYVLAESTDTGTSTVIVPPSALNTGPFTGVKIARKRAVPTPTAVNTPVTGSTVATVGFTAS
jgi:hypothetical protein